MVHSLLSQPLADFRYRHHGYYMYHHDSKFCVCLGHCLPALIGLVRRSGARAGPCGALGSLGLDHKAISKLRRVRVCVCMRVFVCVHICTYMYI